MKSNELTGQKFGKLTAVEPVGRNSRRNIIWRCECECGNTVLVPSSALRSGNTRSCGCLRNGNYTGGCGKGKSNPENLKGRRFGILKAVEIVGRTNDRHAIWKCLCDCGNTIEVSSRALRQGYARDCGCMIKTEHHEEEDERLYKVWAGMKQRCLNDKHISYKHYGALGVRVCNEWSDSFLSFRRWAIESGYNPKAKRGECTLDRIDPFGNYEPSNCRWISISEQQKNKRVNHGTAQL